MTFGQILVMLSPAIPNIMTPGVGSKAACFALRIPRRPASPLPILSKFGIAVLSLNRLFLSFGVVEYIISPEENSSLVQIVTSSCQVIFTVI